MDKKTTVIKIFFLPALHKKKYFGIIDG